MAFKEAYRYALKNGGSDKLREICCGDPRHAYSYARYVDKCPRDDTRKACCKDPYEAYWYSRYVDECPRDDTRRACYKSAYYYQSYLKYVLELKYSEELNLMPKIKRINHGF